MNVGHKVTPATGESTGSPASDAAITRVLQAEVAARATIALAHQHALETAEAARRHAAAQAERTERRIRTVVAAFERELGQRLAEIEAQAISLAHPPPWSEGELGRLQAAVRTLARELVEGRP
jgi:hypothetical protein